MTDRGITLTCRIALAVIVAATQLAGADAAAASLRDEQHCLALALYWEARGEGRSGMVAVGWTILNRVHSRDFPSTPCAVVRQGGEQPPCQFSWWCDGKSDRPRERRSWNTALLTAAELMHDPPADPTGGSLYYHNSRVRPGWTGSLTRTARIGSHIFYR